MKSSGRFTLIYSTCDQYSFMWNDFFRLFYKNWPTFNEKIISTGSLPIQNYPQIIVTKTAFKSFSSRLIKALKKCNTDIVLFMLDDFFLTDFVKTDIFNNALSIMERDKDIKSICFLDYKTDEEYSKEEYNEFFNVKRNDVRWSVTTQVSLWRKDYLLKLLHPGENAWDFERNVQIRHKKYNGKFLYRKDKYYNIFSYPYGGVFDGGHVRNSNEVRDLVLREKINVDNYITPNLFSNQRFLLLRKIWRKFYFRFHIIIPFLPYF